MTLLENPTKTDTSRPMVRTANEKPRHTLIAERAYQLWLDRGCPDGSAERDWLDAEEEIGELWTGSGQEPLEEQ